MWPCWPAKSVDVKCGSIFYDDRYQFRHSKVASFFHTSQRLGRPNTFLLSGSRSCAWRTTRASRSCWWATRRTWARRGACRWTRAASARAPGTCLTSRPAPRRARTSTRYYDTRTRTVCQKFVENNSPNCVTESQLVQYWITVRLG